MPFSLIGISLMVGCFGRERVRPLSCIKKASFEFLNERLEYYAHSPFTCDVMLFGSLEWLLRLYACQIITQFF